MESLILPGRCKQFFVETSFGKELEWFWTSLWNHGAQALKNADHVVICGYSMPKADERARQLLLKQTKKDAYTIRWRQRKNFERVPRCWIQRCQGDWTWLF